MTITYTRLREICRGHAPLIKPSLTEVCGKCVGRSVMGVGEGTQPEANTGLPGHVQRARE